MRSTGESKRTNKTEEIRCTKCGNLICKKYEWADTRGILFWCRKCKENFEIK